MTPLRFELLRRAIDRHLGWADEFMRVGEFAGVVEELEDARAIAEEMVYESAIPEPVR
jgi:hypothetical protein